MSFFDSIQLIIVGFSMNYKRSNTQFVIRCHTGYLTMILLWTSKMPGKRPKIVLMSSAEMIDPPRGSFSSGSLNT